MTARRVKREDAQKPKRSGQSKRQQEQAIKRRRLAEQLLMM